MNMKLCPICNKDYMSCEHTVSQVEYFKIGKEETLEWVKEQIKKIRPYHIHGSVKEGWTPCANLEDIMKILEEKRNENNKP